jgi:hypothetical protein
MVFLFEADNILHVVAGCFVRRKLKGGMKITFSRMAATPYTEFVEAETFRLKELKVSVLKCLNQK